MLHRCIAAHYTKKILHTRWKVSVHHFPNQQTFARKHSIINLLRSCLSKPLQHSGIIPFYSQLLKNSSKLYKNTALRYPPTNSPKHQSVTLENNPIFHFQLHIFQAPYFIQQTHQLRTRLFNAIKHI